MPDATDGELRAKPTALSERERRRPGRPARVSPEILALLRSPAGDGAIPQSDIEAKAPPSRRERTVTLEMRMIDFLLGHRGKAFCDACLKQQFHEARPAEVAVAARAIGAAVRFRKGIEPCRGCEKTRSGIKAR